MAPSDPTTIEVLDALSSPLPTDPHSLSRRRFLQGAALGTGLTLLPGWMTSAAAAAASGNQRAPSPYAAAASRQASPQNHACEMPRSRA